MTSQGIKIGLPTVFAAILFSAILGTESWAQEKVDELANKLPPSANVIMLIDVQGIQDSPLASSDPWVRSVSDLYGTGLGKVLRNSSLAVVGANVNQRWSEPVWRAALMAERGASSFPATKQAYTDKIDRHLGFEFIEMENDSYVFSPQTGLIGVFVPVERQFFSHWLQHLREPSAWLNGSNLIRAVDKFRATETQVVIGADLRYSYSPLRILEEVRDSGFLSEQKIDAKQFSRLASTIDSFTIAANFSENIDCVVEFKFTEDVTPLKPVVRELAFDFLEDAGIHIPEMADWRMNVNKNGVKLSGPISINGFRLMVSELDLINELPAWTDVDEQASDPLTTTREYFKTVNQLLEDLENHRTASVNFGSNANWMDRYAKRIQRLPTRFVDAEVVDYADQAILVLIEASTALRNTAEKNKTDVAGLRQKRSRGRGDFGSLSVSKYRGRRFSRFSRASGGTGKYERQHQVQQNAEGVWVDINLKFEELAKAALKLQRKLEQKFDPDY